MVKTLKRAFARVQNFLTYGIFRRTFLWIFSLTAAAVLTLSCVMIFTFNLNATKRADAASHMIAEQMATALDSYVNTMKEVLFMLSQEAALPDIVNEEFSSFRSRYGAYASFYNHASTLIRYKNYVQLFLLLPQQSTVVSNESTMTGVDIESLSYPGWMETVDQKEIYFSYLETFTPPIPLRDPLGFALVAPLNKLSSDYLKFPAYLVMTTGRINFRKAISSSVESQVGFYIIRNEQGEVIYSSGQATLESAMDQQLRAIPFRSEENQPGTLTLDGAYYRAYQAPLSTLTWEVLYFSDPALMLDSGRDLVNFLLLATALCLLGALLAATPVTRRITRPIREIARVVRAMDGQNFELRIEHISNDELGALSSDINEMAERLHTLIEQVYQAQLLQKDAQLFALQQQINPHFLYNTLEIINSLANQGGLYASEIRQVVQKLTSLFRYSSSVADGGVALISSEIRHALDYMAIQQIRFQDRVRFEHSEEEAVTTCYTPKFLLQPLLENAISHGVYSLSEQGLIALTVERAGEDVCFTVRDNGAGISEETLLALREKLRCATDPTATRPQSIGLQNVHARVRLMFGAPYGLEIESREGEGATVRVRIPMVFSRYGAR